MESKAGFVCDFIRTWRRTWRISIVVVKQRPSPQTIDRFVVNLLVRCDVLTELMFNVCGIKCNFTDRDQLQVKQFGRDQRRTPCLTLTKSFRIVVFGTQILWIWPKIINRLIGGIYLSCKRSIHFENYELFWKLKHLPGIFSLTWILSHGWGTAGCFCFKGASFFFPFFISAYSSNLGAMTRTSWRTPDIKTSCSWKLGKKHEESPLFRYDSDNSCFCWVSSMGFSIKTEYTHPET